MKIHFLKEDALVYFKNNIDKHLDHYLDEDNSWMIEIYKEYRGEDESPFGEFKLGVDEIKMYMPAEKAELTDYNNVKIFFCEVIHENTEINFHLLRMRAHDNEMVRKMPVLRRLELDGGGRTRAGFRVADKPLDKAPFTRLCRRSRQVQ